MTFTYFPYEPIDIDRGLSIEILNIKLYQTFIKQFLCGFEGSEERAALFEGDKQVSFGSGIVITDLFRFDVNDKKLSAKLASDIVKRMNCDAEFMLKAETLLSQLSGLVRNFGLDYSVEIGYNEIILEDVIRLLGPRVDSVFDDIAATLTSFFDVAAQFNLYKYVAVVGLIDLLGEAAFAEVLRHARSHSIRLLTIDRFRHKHLSDERTLTIEEDFNEIIQ